MKIILDKQECDELAILNKDENLLYVSIYYDMMEMDNYPENDHILLFSPEDSTIRTRDI